MPRTAILGAWLRTYCLPICYSIFLTSLALEWNVNTGRTIALFSSLVYLYFTPSIRKKLFRSAQMRLALCFPLIAVVAWATSPYGNGGLKTLDWIICLGIGYVAAMALERKAILLLLILPAVCLAASMATTLWEFCSSENYLAIFHNFTRLKMYNASANRYGLTAAFSAVALIGLFPLATPRNRLILLLMFIPLFFLCWYSQSRAAMFALVGTICLASVIFIKKLPKLGLLILLIISCMFAAGALVGGGRILTTITKGSVDYLLNGRYDIWQASWEIFQKSPWVGFGVDSFRQTLEVHLNLPENASRFPDIRSQYIFWNAHQIILGIMAETGLAGLVVFIVISAKAIWNGIKKYPLALAPLLIFILYWINGLGGYGFHRSWNSAFFFLAVGLIDGIAPIARPRLSSEIPSPSKTALQKL